MRAAPTLLVWGTVVASVIAVVLSVRLYRIGRPLGAGGIIPLEFAFTPERAARLMERWGQQGLQAAYRSIALDYFFIPAYATAIAGILAIVVWPLHDAALGGLPVGTPILAGVLDVAENLFLERGLHAGDRGRSAWLWAGVFASAKFLLLVAAIAYGVAAWWHVRAGGIQPPS